MSLGDPLRGLAKGASRFYDEWPLAGARIVEAEATRQAASATGGDGRLSGWRSIGTADVSVTGGPGEASAAATGGGLWRVLEEGTRPHDVAAKRADALATPYGPRKRVHVRGRPAMATWSRALAAADRQVMRETDARLARMGG